MSMQTIWDLPGALFRAITGGDGNELALDAKAGVKPDPVKFRGGSWQSTGHYVILSGDRLEGDANDPTRHEQGFLSIREDDHPDAHGAACFEFYTEDKIRARLGARGLELFVPLLQGVPPAHPPSGGPGVQLGTQDGRYIVADQTDGNLVVYDKGVAVWDRWSHEATHP